MKEIIIKAAILIEHPLLTGPNHSICISKIKSVMKQGFIAKSEITGGKRFVDRKEALEIAISAGQTIHKHSPYNKLLSEDLRNDKHFKKSEDK